MKEIVMSLIFVNIAFSLSACATTSSRSTDQNSNAPLSRHDRLWNPHLERW